MSDTELRDIVTGQVSQETLGGDMHTGSLLRSALWIHTMGEPRKQDLAEEAEPCYIKAVANPLGAPHRGAAPMKEN
jgi:hypothetical protein